MGRALVVAAVQLAVAFAVAAAVGLVLTLLLTVVSGNTFADELHRVMLVLGIAALLCAAAAQSPTRRLGSGPGYNRLGGLVPGLNRYVTSKEAAASGSLTPTAVFLVVAIVNLAIAFSV